jgi:transcriptional regulator with XRE-family HTH domain
MAIRDERQLTQSEMADLLAMSPSAYSRLERNQTKVTLEDLPRISDKLNVPIQDLLPEIFTVHNNPSGGSTGVVFNQSIINNYYSTSETTKELETKIQALEKKLSELLKERGD